MRINRYELLFFLAMIVSLAGNMCLLVLNKRLRAITAFQNDDYAIVVIAKKDILEQCGYQMDKAILLQIKQK